MTLQEFKIILDSKWNKGDVFCNELIVLEKPKRKWYKALLEFISFRYYIAPWEYKVKLLNESKKD
jgi:hypothetical protein